jgi:hypothetical protein
MNRSGRLIALVSVAALAVAGCGSSSNTSSTAANPNAKEKSPPGDIPDSTQFVRFTVPGGAFSVKVPEGWGKTGSGSKLTFTSNLNSVSVEQQARAGALSAAAVKRHDVSALANALKGFKLKSVAPIHRSGQTAVRIRYLAKAKPDPVTGKTVTDAAERYVFVQNGKEAIITLAGPNGADNVDAWRTISDSLSWSK